MNMSNDSTTTAVAGSQLPSPAPRRWRTVFLLTVIFLAGIAVGTAGTVTLAIHGLQKAIKNPRMVPERATLRLSRLLDLDEQQTADVRRSLSELQERLFEIRSTVYPEVQAEIARSRQEISDVLNEQQRAKWDKIFSRVRDRWMLPPPDQLESQR